MNHKPQIIYTDNYVKFDENIHLGPLPSNINSLAYKNLEYVRNNIDEFLKIIPDLNIIRKNFNLDPIELNPVCIARYITKIHFGAKRFLTRYIYSNPLNGSLRLVRHEQAVLNKPKKTIQIEQETLKKQIVAARSFSKKEQIKFKPGYVYVISNPAWSGMLKIGSTLDVKARLGNFQVGDPYAAYQIEFYEIVPDRRAVERFIHKSFVNFHIRGEWFKLNLNQVKKIIKNYKKHIDVNHNAVYDINCVEHNV